VPVRMVIHFALPSVKTGGLMRVEKRPIMHLIQAGNWSCSAAAVVDVEGLAYTVKTAADVVILAVVVIEAGASAH
jgi:hypothetical protein